MRTRLRYDWENWDLSEEAQIDHPRYRLMPNNQRRVVLYSRTRRSHKPRAVYDVIRETKTLVIVGRNGKEMERLTKPRHGGEFHYATADEVKKAEMHLAKQERQRQELAAQQKALEADPHYQLVKRLRNADFEPYHKLSLEQLQQIAAWLDEAKG